MFRMLGRGMLLTVLTPVLVAAAPNEAPLVLAPEKTAILDGSVYAGKYLQYALIKYVAKDPQAEAFRIDAKPRPDRAGATVFPLFGRKDDLPAGRTVLAIGRTPYLTDEDRKRLDEKAGTVLVQRRGGVIVVAGSQQNRSWGSEMAAMRIFLDKGCGVRMYAPDGADGLEWVSMPDQREITIDILDIFMKPYFAKTTFSSGGHERNRNWIRMNVMVSEGLNLRASHTIIRYFPPEKYYEKHPRLYPMHQNGERPRPIRDAWNPCLADPDLSARIAMEQIREWMGGKRKPTYLSFGVMDCKYDCQCPVCRKSMKAMDGNAANLWYTFMNKVAKQCQKEFPELYLTSYAYSNIGIPTGMRIEPNIVIDNVIKTYRFIDPEYAEAEKRAILKFADLGASWITHDWNFQGVTPRIYSRQLASFLQWGAQNGMKGIYTEWSGREYWYLAGAHYWVLRQLLSDPYQDTDRLWLQYCRDMYGEGWEEMYRFYDLFQQKQVVADKYFLRQDWPRQDVAGFLPVDIAAQRAWLETAIERTRHDPMIRKRLAAVMRYFRAHELLAQATAVPARLHHRFTVLGEKEGINKEALAFYANDDGGKLLEFEEYYDTRRTVAPDSNAEDKNSSLRFSYRNNYARALGEIIRAVKTRALEGMDLTKADRTIVENIRARAMAVYRRALPPRYDRKRAEDIGELMTKILWVPRLETLPEMDGELDDAVWQKAAPLTGWTQADLLIPSADGNQTGGRIMRVGDHLLVGLVCQQPKGIWAETPPDIHTGTRIWREAGCEFFLGPPPAADEDPVYFQYIVNALGAFRGFRAARDNREGVTCAVKLAPDKKSYTIEAAFPLKVKDMYDFTGGRVFTFNVMRNPFYADTFNSKERIGWAPLFFTAHNIESRGLIVFE